MRKKQIGALLTALALAVGLAGCGQQAEEEAAPQSTAVEVQTVGRGDIATESVVTGSVLANRDVPMLAPVAGKVKEVRVRAGDTVKAGQVLFVMDTADLQDTYGSALTTYTSTKALLDEQVRQTQKTVENLRALFELGAVSQNDVEQAELGLMQAENARETTLAQMGLDKVLETINAPAVTSTISGTVASVSVTAGVQVSNTAPAVVVSEIGRPQAVVSISETLQPYVSVGDQVEVLIQSQGDQPVTGTVASVASAVSANTALYEVHIDLPETLNLSIGMFARATFRTDERKDTVLIPTESILTDGDDQYVFVVSEGTAYRVNVTTGLVGEADTEITTGLHGGEQLVTRGQSYLSDGAVVRVTAIDGEPVAEEAAPEEETPGAADSGGEPGGTDGADAPEGGAEPAPADAGGAASTGEGQRA